MKQMSFENQVAIVIGASSNIGKQVATELLKQGAKVILLDSEKEQLFELYMQLRSKFENKVFFFEFDITDKWQVFQFLDMVEQDFGPINNLVNCSDLLALESIKSNNSKSNQPKYYLSTLEAIAKKMAKQNSSSIVTIESQPKDNFKQSISRFIEVLNAFGVRFNILSSKIINSQIPVYKMIDFESKISNTIIYLLSDKAKHINMQSLTFNGYPEIKSIK